MSTPLLSVSITMDDLEGILLSKITLWWLSRKRQMDIGADSRQSALS